MSQIRRRKILLVTGALFMAPLVRAQQSTMPVVGFLGSESADSYAHLAAGFRQGLQETGFVDGQNVVIEYRWAQGQFDRLPALADELVRRQVAAIFASGGAIAALTAKAATKTIPIVFVIGSDPVKDSLVASLNLPGGNVTGVTLLSRELDAKRLELLRQIVPNAAVIGVLLNPGVPGADLQMHNLQSAARSVGQQIYVVTASRNSELETAFATFVQKSVGALLVGAGAFFHNRRKQLVAFAARSAIPATYPLREFALAGGLMSYGANITDAYRQAGTYTGRILKGAKPANLPVVQSTKFELVINLQTAKALGISIPQSVLVRADEVIQ